MSLRDCFSLFTKEEELESENAPVCGVHKGYSGGRVSVIWDCMTPQCEERYDVSEFV